MADYAFYRDAYHGTAISQADWPRLSGRAADVLARYQRVYRVTVPAEDAMDMAQCAMAEAFAEFEGSGSLTAAAIGSVSVRYGGATPRQREEILYRLACRYLDIYRGAAG